MNFKKLTSLILSGVLTLGCAYFYAPVASAKSVSILNVPIFAYTDYDKKAKLDVTGDGAYDTFSFAPVESEFGEDVYDNFEITFKASDTKKQITQTLADPDKNPYDEFSFDTEEQVLEAKAGYDEATSKKDDYSTGGNSLRLIRLKNGSVFLFANPSGDSDMTDPRFYQYLPKTGKFALVKNAWLRDLFDTSSMEKDMDCPIHSAFISDISGNYIRMEVFFTSPSGLGQWYSNVDFGCVDTSTKVGKLQMVNVSNKGVIKAKTNGTFDITKSVHLQYTKDMNGEDITYLAFGEADIWTHKLTKALNVYTTPDLKTTKKDAKKKTVKLNKGTKLYVTKYYFKNDKTSLFIETKSGIKIKGWIKDSAYTKNGTLTPYFKEAVFI